MAWYIDTWRERYPRTIEFLRRDLVGLTVQNQKIWNAFCTTAELTQQDAEKAITFGTTSDSPPLIWFKKLGAIAGFFDTEFAGRIEINAEIARQFESVAGDDAARSYLQAKVLHEIVHWSLFKQGDKEPSSVEKGVEFEDFAYDSPLVPFWLGAPIPPIPATASPTSLGDHGAVEPIIAADEFTNAHLAAGLPRGIRNNNPGNIKRTGIAWDGLANANEMTEFQRIESVFCVFREPIWGLRAMARILYTYQRHYGLTSVESIIARWAPASDNNKTDAYINFVANRMGITSNQSFQFTDKGKATPMIAAMISVENGMQPYTMQQIERAHDMAMV